MLKIKSSRQLEEKSLEKKFGNHFYWVGKRNAPGHATRACHQAYGVSG
jgi:hypothetical protein